MSKKEAAAKAKKYVGFIKLYVNAGQAKPAPPVGPALGQAGLNLMTVCKDFNAKTASIRDDVPLRVKIKYYDDKSYDMRILNPETIWYVKRCAGITRGAPDGKTIAGAITLKHVYHIAEQKQKDLPDLSLEQISRMIIASCKSYGVVVVRRPEDAPPQFLPPTSAAAGAGAAAPAAAGGK